MTKHTVQNSVTHSAMHLTWLFMSSVINETKVISAVTRDVHFKLISIKRASYSFLQYLWYTTRMQTWTQSVNFQHLHKKLIYLVFATHIFFFLMFKIALLNTDMFHWTIPIQCTVYIHVNRHCLPATSPFCDFALVSQSAVPASREDMNPDTDRER